MRQVAQKDKEARFTALLHHVSLERLVMAYWDLSPKAAPGVDGVTWAAYGQDLAGNLRDLHQRAGAQPASGAGCAGDRDHGQEGELGAGRGHPRLLRPA